MEKFISVASDTAHGAALLIAFLYTYFLKFIFEDIGTVLLAGTVLFISAATLKASRRDARQMLSLMTQQARAATLSTVREAWVNDLRDTLAGYLSCCDALSAMFTQNQTVNSLFLDTMRTANEYESRLYLLLNPDAPEQKTLFDAIKIAAMQVTNYHPVDKAPVIKAGQDVFRATWATIKADAAPLPVLYSPSKDKPWYERLWRDLTE